jgi:hypothetical protein
VRIASSVVSAVLVAIIGGSVILAVWGDSPTHRSPGRISTSKVFQIDVRTDERWVTTLTAEQRAAAAREAVAGWFKAASEDDLDEVVRRSGVPFWVDGGMADSEAALRKYLKPSVGHTPFIPSRFEVVEDFCHLASAQRYPMNGMLVRASHGEMSVLMSVHFGKSVLIVGSD